MAEKQLSQAAQWDHEFVWHPFTQMQDWLAQEPVVIERGEGVYLIDENGKKHKYMRNTPKSVWTAKLRCSCGAGFIQFKWRVNRDGAVIHGFQCYRRTRRPSISYLQEHGLDLGISCRIKAICEWKLDLMAAKVFFMAYSSPLAASMVSSSVLTPGYCSS